MIYLKYIFVLLNLISLFRDVQCVHNLETPENNVGIYGGQEISINEVPYMASLRLDGKSHFCGATIIHERFILTAAHCIIPNRKYKVVVGTDDIKYGGQLIEIDKIIVHENFNPSTQDYDICIIKLNETLVFGDNVMKIELADTSPRLERLVQATGWGKTPNGSLSQRLLQVTIPIVSRRVCSLDYLKYKHVITRRMLCAGELGRDSCQADSGGPLTFRNKQVGIISFGFAICGLKPGVYTKISTLRSWIFENMLTNL